MPSASAVQPLIRTIHDSVMDIPSSEWAAIVGDEHNVVADLAMDRRLIAVQERTLRDQCRIWTVMLREPDGTPIACACLCLFRVDGTLSAHPAASGAVDLARRAFPGLLRFGVLFCGLPAPAGESHVRIAPGADASAVMAALDDVMRDLASRHSATLIVHKEFGERQHACGRWLAQQRFIAGDVPPMHCLRGGFRDFQHFLGSMRSRYRAQVQRSLRKIDSAGLKIEHIDDARGIQRAFTPQLHGLYDAVWRNSQYKLERLPLEFFRDAAAAMKGERSLTVIRRRDDVVGFTFSIACGSTWHNLYSGVDYSLNGEADILFNLFYADLAQAFASGCSDIRLGQTSDTFKQRLGCVAEPLRFFVRARSPMLHAGLRAFLGRVVSGHRADAPGHVFKEDAGDAVPAECAAEQPEPALASL